MGNGLLTISSASGQIVESTPSRPRRYYLARIADAGPVPWSTFKGQMAEMVDFGPKEGTFVQVTERNRTVLCPVPGRAHAIVARGRVVQALAPYLVVGVLWAPAVDRLCYGFAPIPRWLAARSGCCQLRQGAEPASWRGIPGS